MTRRQLHNRLIFCSSCICYACVKAIEKFLRTPRIGGILAREKVWPNFTNSLDLTSVPSYVIGRENTSKTTYFYLATHIEIIYTVIRRLSVLSMFVYTAVSNRFDNRFDNRLYRVNGAL